MERHEGENALLEVNALSSMQWLVMKSPPSCCSAINTTEEDLMSIIQDPQNHDYQIQNGNKSMKNLLA